jgi:hypothetical protein
VDLSVCLLPYSTNSYLYLKLFYPVFHTKIHILIEGLTTSQAFSGASSFTFVLQSNDGTNRNTLSYFIQQFTHFITS